MLMKLLYRAIVVIGCGLFLWANAAFFGAKAPCGAEEYDRVDGLLRALKGGMHGDLPQRMQRLFPEGGAFAYALYGLARCDQMDRTVHEEGRLALTEALWSLRQLEGDEARERFDPELQPEGGAFIAGWTAYLQGRIMLADPSARKSEMMSFTMRCDRIAAKLASDPVPYLQSYPERSWPADVTVCIAALAAHDRMGVPRYADVRTRWVEDVRKRLDARGMIPHAWLVHLDTVHQAARGSSMSLMCAFLPEIDGSLAREQYALFKQHFIDPRFGSTVVLEHPKGVHEPGDIDSGPLILGAGPAATIVAAAACRANGDKALAYQFARTVDAWGFVTGGDERRYLFGALPIADLFIAWSRSRACSGSDASSPVPGTATFHLWSIAFCAMLAAPWLWTGCRRWRRTGRAQ